jgi:hypothetical protein
MTIAERRPAELAKSQLSVPLISASARELRQALASANDGERCEPSN